MNKLTTKIDAIDIAVHEIEQMVEVAVRASESLLGAEHDKRKFEMPANDAQLLDFALYDVAKRVEALRKIMQEPEGGDDECA